MPLLLYIILHIIFKFNGVTRERGRPKASLSYFAYDLEIKIFLFTEERGGRLFLRREATSPQLCQCLNVNIFNSKYNTS
jgi:hypothetical protein